MAFGVVDDSPPELFLIALATLHLLSDTAARAPILLVVEDSHWLDRPTADALTFVARRLESDPIVMLVALREGYETPLDAGGLPELRLDQLDDPTSARLLDARNPELQADLKAQILDEAEGDPLALIELPASLGSKTLGDTVSRLAPWQPTRSPLASGKLSCRVLRHGDRWRPLWERSGSICLLCWWRRLTFVRESDRRPGARSTTALSWPGAWR